MYKCIFSKTEKESFIPSALSLSPSLPPPYIVIMQPLFTLSTSFYFENNPPIVIDSSPNHTPKPPHRNLSSKSIPEEQEEQEEKEENPNILTPPTLTTTPPEVRILIEETDNNSSMDTPLSEATATTGNSSPLEGHISERKVVNSKEKKSVFKNLKNKSRRMKSKKKSQEGLHHEEGEGDSADGELEDMPTHPETTPSKPKDLPIGGAMSSKRKTRSFSRKVSSDSLKAVTTPNEEGSPLTSVSTSSLKAPEDYVVVSLVNSTLYRKSEEMAVHQMSMCPYARHLCVANISGHVMVFHFSMSPTDCKPKVSTCMCVCISTCIWELLYNRYH